MTVRDLVKRLMDEDMDARVVLNIWTDEPDTVEGEATMVVAVSAGVAIKGDEIV